MIQVVITKSLLNCVVEKKERVSELARFRKLIA